MSQALPPAVKIGLRESSTVRWEHGSWEALRGEHADRVRGVGMFALGRQRAASCRLSTQ